MPNRCMNGLMDGIVIWGDESETGPMLVLDHNPSGDGYVVSIWSEEGDETKRETFETLQEAMINFTERMAP